MKCLRAAFLLSLCTALAPAKVIQIIDGYQATYPKGKIGGSSATGVPAAFVPIPPAREYYLDYQVRFESDWEWVKGGKLPGFVGGSHTTGCKSIVPDGWSTRFMWRGGGQGQVYMYHQNRKSGCGDEYDFPNPGGTFSKGQWNRLTQHVVINTPGKNDGLVEAWLEGKKKSTLTNIQLRGKVSETTALVDAVSLQTFYGGSSSTWAPPHDTHATFSTYYVRDDLPDFSVPFEDASTSVRPGVPGIASAGKSRTISWLGNGNVTLGSGAAGRINVFDASGSLLRSLPGSGARVWDGLDGQGRLVRPGILLVQIESTSR